MSGNQLQPVLDPHALARELSGKLLIDGALVPAASGKTFAIVGFPKTSSGRMPWMAILEAENSSSGSISMLRDLKTSPARK